MTAAGSPEPGDVPDHDAEFPVREDENVVPVAADGAGTGDVPRGEVEAGQLGQRRGEQAAVQRYRGLGVIL